MKLSIALPVYDDLPEAARMIEAVEQSVSGQITLEFLIMDLRGDWCSQISKLQAASPLRCLAARNLPAAKNMAAAAASGEFLLFLFPGIFPARGAIEKLIGRLECDPALAAAAGRWSNAAGKLEVGYNVRRFPTFTALILDILLLNKLLPANRFTRRYKMHDFDHRSAIRAEHANDCVFMVRRQAVMRHGGFKEKYEPGWFDQVEFCQSLNRAGEHILYAPEAEFVANEKLTLIGRLVADRYAGYRRAECLYIRNHFGRLPAALARAATAIGMLQRIGFSFVFPPGVQKWFILTLRSYVNDDYIRSLRRDYWTVFKQSLRGER